MIRLGLLLTVLCGSAVIAEDYDKLSMEDLLDIRLPSSAALTYVDRNNEPAALTRITREEIVNSGARNLDELLEIYVPNYQSVRLNTTGTKLGIRGIVSDLDNKFLLLVNGRVMNDKTAYGAETERYMSMMGDIFYIDVIRGPGSAIYGPGAIGGVINIITHNALNFEGTQISARQGAVEEFTNFEYSQSWKLTQEEGFYLYYGVDYYQGSQADDSPLVFSHRLNNLNNSPGQAITSGIERESAAYRDHTRHKLHFSYESEFWSSWIRYTKGGERTVAPHSNIEGTPTDPSFGLSESDYGTAYQQLTLFAKRKFELSETLDLQLSLSYDWKDKEQQRPYLERVMDTGRAFIHYMEEELHAKALFNWIYSLDYSMAFGLEYSHDKFLERSPGYPHQDPFIFVTAPWTSDTLSLLMEHQYHLDLKNTLFAGARMDKHTFTDWLFSPRLAWIYKPDERKTLKVLYNRSVRRNDDFELIEQDRAGNDGDTETIDQVELRYEECLSQSSRWAGSLFYSRHDIVNFDFINYRSIPLGTMQIAGIDLEYHYKAEDFSLSASHGFVYLMNFKLDTDGSEQFNSSEPDNGSNHLANWSDHISKFQGNYFLTPDVTLHSSLIVYWGFPGAEDFTDYNNSLTEPRRYKSISDGNSEAFGENIYLNLGATWKPSKNSALRLQLHNVMGWIDKDYNKRNYYGLFSTYRSEAAAVSLSYTCKF